MKTRNSFFHRFGILAAWLACTIGAHAVVLPPGLVGYWQADNSATDTVANSDGVLVGGTTFAPGYIQQGFQLDGVNDQVRVPYVSAFSLTNLSVAFWFKPTVNAIPDDENLVGKNGFTAGDWGFAVDTQGNFVRQVKFRALGATIIGAPLSGGDTNAATYLNHYFHVTGTIASGGNVSLYINGVLGSQTTLAGTLPTSVQDIYFSGNNSLTKYFGGIIDEVQIYNHALSAAEVFQVYSAPEPTTLTFLGLGGILFLCRRKR